MIKKFGLLAPFNFVTTHLIVTSCCQRSKACATPLLIMVYVTGLFPLCNEGFLMITIKQTPHFCTKNHDIFFKFSLRPYEVVEGK